MSKWDFLLTALLLASMAALAAVIAAALARPDLLVNLIPTR